MQHLLYELPKPIIFAHRGSSAYAPENTLAAFELAVKQEAPALELDVKLTHDGEVVVIHDPTTQRTCGKEGIVKNLTLAQLKQLDAGSHFDASFNGEKIPTLQEVFDAVGKKLLINVEITNYTSPLDDLPIKVAQLVKNNQLQEWVFFSSFNPIALWKIKKLLPQIPIGLLAEEGKRGNWARSKWLEWLNYEAIHPHHDDVTPAFVKYHHQKKRLINVYTVNQAEKMRQLFQMQVDGIFTDDPILAKQNLEKMETI
ncbi:MAG: glycerophosphodiester phosphodiesterase [Anaerolineales bacterium]